MLLSFLLGLASLAGAYFSYTKTRRFLQEGVATQGKIIRVEKEKNTTTDEDGYSSTNNSYYPVIEFVDRQGKTYEFRASVGVSSKRKWKVGATQEIVYPPVEPEKAKIKSFLQLWFAVIIFATIGIIFTLASAMTYFG